MGQGKGVFKKSNSKRWWIRYSVRGKQFRESSGSEDRKVAERLLKRRLQEVAADQLGARRFVGPDQERVMVHELLDALLNRFDLNKRRWRTEFLSHLKPVGRAFGSWPALRVTSEEIDRYKLERLAEGRAPATVNQELQILGQAFRLGVNQGKITTVPLIERLPADNVRQGFFEAHEFQAVVKELPEYLKDF